MTVEEIKNLGERLGLELYDETSAYINFLVGNGQIYSIYVDLDDDDILGNLGNALISKGKILKKLEINRILSITNGD